MNKDQATHIIRSLADGIDPVSNQAYPPNSPWQQPPIIRALNHAAECMAASGDAQPARGAASRSGQPWSDEEEQEMLKLFDDGTAESKIGQQLGRSRVAVQARLAKFGRVEEPAGLRQATG